MNGTLGQNGWYVSDVAVTAAVTGNQARKTCSYRVVVPKCHGRTPTLLGTGANSAINGTAGNDVICGGEGDDDIYGGDDNLDGGPGNDSILGDDGADNCVSGEVRMSSCATFYAYDPPACGLGSELGLVVGALAWLRARVRRA